MGSSAAKSPSGELLADRAYAELRDRIVKLQIEPGAPLDEDSLGQALGVGRTPLREAIRRLALENLVVVRPRRGTFVSEIDPTDLAQVADVRMQLEGHAAFRAAQRLTPARREELDQLRADLAGLDARRDIDALMALDARLHRFVYACADNRFMEATLDGYFNLSLRMWYRVLDRVPDLFAHVHEHDAALAAIADGDAERARELLIEHVATFEREIRSVL